MPMRGSLKTWRVELIAEVEAARTFARKYHEGQTDKLKIPYIYHLEDVVRCVSNLGSLIVCIAWLHDCVEDTSATLDEIEEQFGRAVRDGVDAMTKREGEDYFRDYLARLKRNPHAVPVKIADAYHNLGKTHRLERSDPKKAVCLEKKYKHVLAALGVPAFKPERLEFKDGGWRSVRSY
jgi:(p)ppGpp synthase/HD superfamily hydrolase